LACPHKFEQNKIKPSINKLGKKNSFTFNFFTEHFLNDAQRSRLAAGLGSVIRPTSYRTGYEN